MAEFQGITPDAELSGGSTGAGDAKYHLGTTFKRKYGADGKEIKLTLLANPSHLETVAPVVAGRVRAEQHFLGG
jgi:2-oxoglutarate dehydrogenase E1 component